MVILKKGAAFSEHMLNQADEEAFADLMWMLIRSLLLHARLVKHCVLTETERIRTEGGG